MPSLIPGYEYDIFISYRQKDNKHDGWVSKFVENLRGELEATFKEDISIYFDENPHDRLQDTHNVDKSLEGKLKCLIFIPILSQTYCDPNSYAWRYEFLEFNKLSMEDRFGREIKMRNGNYASRILPIRIHDLEPEDIKLFEKETGSVLRAMDFVFKTSSGVNRPLKEYEDNPTDNLNKTFFGDQINKVANAIKEIIIGMKASPGLSDKRIDGEVPLEVNSGDINSRKIIRRTINQNSRQLQVIFLLLMLCAIGAVIIYRFINYGKQNHRTLEIEKTIAVLPFRNLSNDSLQAYFCDGFMEEIMTNLQRVKEFTVRSRTSTDQYRKTSKSIRTIAEEMNANYLIEGSVGKEDNNLKIWVQLINAKTDSHVWANEYTSEMKQVFSLQSEIAKDIAARLKTVLSPEEILQIDKKPTESIEAYNLYLKGRFFWNKRTVDDLKRSIYFFEEAIKIDSMFSLAYTGIADSYIVLGEWSFSPPDEVFPKAKKSALQAIKLDYNLAEAHNALAAIKRDYEWDWNGAENEYLKAIELRPNYATAYQWYSEYLSIMGRDGEAIENLLHAQELEPLSPILYTIGGRITYHYSRQFDQAILQCRKALEIDSNYFLAHYSLADNYIQMKLYTEAIKEINKILLLFKLDPGKSVILARAYALSGRRRDAEAILNEILTDSTKTYNAKTSLASLYLAFDRKEEAMDLIEEAYLRRDYGLIHVYRSPEFDNLRNDPRLNNIIRKMGFKN